MQWRLQELELLGLMKDEQRRQGEYVSPEEELALCRYYEQQIPRMCAKHQLGDVLAHRAIAFMKRFYLSRSVMDYHPKLLVYGLPITLFCRSN